jgi:hypothetical protein
MEGIGLSITFFIGAAIAASLGLTGDNKQFKLEAMNGCFGLPFFNPPKIQILSQTANYSMKPAKHTKVKKI